MKPFTSFRLLTTSISVSIFSGHIEHLDIVIPVKHNLVEDGWTVNDADVRLCGSRE